MPSYSSSIATRVQTLRVQSHRGSGLAPPDPDAHPPHASPRTLIHATPNHCRPLPDSPWVSFRHFHL